MARGFPRQSGGLLVAQWSYRIGRSNWSYFVLRSGATEAIVLVSSSDGTLGLIGGNGAQRPVASVSRDGWHTVRVVVDVASNEYDLYLDGRLEAARARYRNPAGSLDGIEISSGHSATADNLFVDDVSIATVRGP